MPRSTVPVSHTAGDWWVDAGYLPIYLGIAIWAFLAYVKLRGQPQRLLFASIVAVTGLVFGSKILGFLQPQFAAVLRHPVDTVLGYLFAALVITAGAVDARARARGGKQ